MKSKGISPIISALLLLAITVSVFSILLATIHWWLSDQRYYRMQAIRERLIIEDAWFMPPPKDTIIRLTFTNVGKTALAIRMVIVNGRVMWGLKEEKVEIEIGETRIIYVNLSSPWSPNTVYSIRVITERGNEIERIFSAPQRK